MLYLKKLIKLVGGIAVPYQIQYPWRRNPRLLELVFSGEISPDDLQNALEDTTSLLDQALMPLHIIFDFTDTAVLPQDMLNILGNSSAISHPQRGYCVFVRANEFLSFIAKILRSQVGMDIEFVIDTEEAWDFFNEMGIC